MKIKIGSDWIYDTDTCRGSKVMRKADGTVDYFKPAFSLLVSVDRAQDSRYESDKRNDTYKAKFIDFSDESIAFGVVRKAVNMQILDFEGKLDTLNITKDRILT